GSSRPAAAAGPAAGSVVAAVPAPGPFAAAGGSSRPAGRRGAAPVPGAAPVRDWVVDDSADAPAVSGLFSPASPYRCPVAATCIPPHSTREAKTELRSPSFRFASYSSPP